MDEMSASWFKMTPLMWPRLSAKHLIVVVQWESSKKKNLPNSGILKSMKIAECQI